MKRKYFSLRSQTDKMKDNESAKAKREKMKIIKDKIFNVVNDWGGIFEVI